MSINDAVMAKAMRAAFRELPDGVHAMLIVCEVEADTTHTVMNSDPDHVAGFLEIALNTVRRQFAGLPGRRRAKR